MSYSLSYFYSTFYFCFIPYSYDDITFSAVELPIYVQENLIPSEGCNFFFQLRGSPGLEYLEVLASSNKLIQITPLSPPRKQVTLPHLPTQDCSGGPVPLCPLKMQCQSISVFVYRWNF